MTALPAPDLISIDDYLLGEETSDIKHEYLDGLVYAMTGATRRHNLLTGALMEHLRPNARARGCQLFASGMKLRLDHRNETYFYYPDLLLTCSPDDRHPLYCTQPCLLIEVVSPSSERIDRREKHIAYSLLPSLREYLIVEQNRMHIDLHRCTEQGWTHSSHHNGTIHLDCLDCDISLTDIYADLPELLPTIAV